MSAIAADTHAVIWFLSKSKKLSILAADAMTNAIGERQPIYVSSISLVEMVYLVERNRIPKAAFDRFTATLDRRMSAFEVVPLDRPIISELASINSATVPEMPDRIIAATAQLLKVPLVTRDYSIRNLATLETIW